MNLFQCARMELGQYLCYHLDFLLDFFTEDKSYQYLQGATLIALLSDKSAKIFGLKYLIIWKFSIHTFRMEFSDRKWRHSANLHTKHMNTKGENGWFCMESWQFFQYSDPHISVLLSDIKPNEVASFSPW